MKNMNNPTWKTGGMTLMLLCVLFTSCSNEELLGEKNPAEGCNTICFGLTHDAEPSTKGCPKAASAAFTANRFVLRSDQSADTLCLRAVVSDGINASPSTTQQSLTRGVPVTSLSSFHVQGYWTRQDDQTVQDKLFMDEDAAQQEAVWKTQTIYYWPGVHFSLDFYAWAPSVADGLITTNASSDRSLQYTVPDEIAKQSDLVVAKATDVQGDNNAAVGLTFSHLCTQVRFVVGSMMQQGKIESVGFKNVRNAGTFNMETGTWTLNETTQNFSYEANLQTTGSESDGMPITADENTFMMLPQTFESGSTAQVEVVFINQYDERRILTANIANSEWPIGKTVTYRLSISPEYDLNFVTTTPVVDAHYVMLPIVIKCGTKFPETNWVVQVENPNNESWIEGVTLRKSSDLLAIEKEGYWLENKQQNGYTLRTQAETYPFTTNHTDTVYLFMEENYPANADRSVTLSLAPASKPTNVSDRITIRQRAAYPAQGDVFVERIEEDPVVPWGFAWENTKEEFRTTQGSGFKVPPGQIDKIKDALNNAGYGQLPDYITIVSKDNNNGILLSIDYSKITIDITFSDTDGQANTMALYNFDGISYISALKNFIASLGNVIHTNGSGDVVVENPLEFAALSALKKNRFSLRTASDGAGGMLYIPELADAYANWYLPAKEQMGSVSEISDAIMEGTYWTSTGINDNQQAYSWQNNSWNTSPRMDKFKVRAVRRK